MSTAEAGDGGPQEDAVVRRAPFSDNPAVGVRGQRTQQRILEAALQVFGEVGYHSCSIDRISKAAGCSRISFYQYFSGKEDVFRQLAGQVARESATSTAALGPLTAGADGWAELRRWVADYDDLHRRYEPVFTAFQSAIATDEAVIDGSRRVGERTVNRLQGLVAGTDLDPREVPAVLDLLTKSMAATLAIAATVRSGAPDAYPRARVDDAVTDVLHRTLFGLDPDVNVHPPDRGRTVELAFGPAMQQVIDHQHDASELTPAGRRTLEALLQAGHQELVERGYHRTRVDDVVRSAALSHGAFYRYFENKDHFVRLLAGQAMRTVAVAFVDIPTEAVHGGATDTGGNALRSWLQRYNAAHAAEASVIRAWTDASFHDPTMRAESAAVFDWGRRQLAGFLAPRGFGDVDTEALFLVGLLEAFGTRPRSSAATETAATIIERGLLGR